MILAPSILAADLSRLGQEIAAVERGGAGVIHVDIMDGHFVPNLTLGPAVVKAVRRVTRLPIDVHLMVERAERHIDAFIDAGADWVSLHVEAVTHLQRAVAYLSERGVKAGVVLNPSTPLSSIEWIIEDVDFIMIMSVNPGFGGQKFIPNSLDRVKALREMIRERELETLIEIDGGVNENTIKNISDAGVDVFVAGSAVFKSPDYKKTIAKFRELING